MQTKTSRQTTPEIVFNGKVGFLFFPNLKTAGYSAEVDLTIPHALILLSLRAVRRGIFLK